MLGVFGPNNSTDVNAEGENWYWQTGDQVMMEYKKHYDDLNLKKNSMRDILNHKWFTKILPDSWKKEETRLDACRQYCEHYEEE
jgi:hypothetical protein